MLARTPCLMFGQALKSVVLRRAGIGQRLRTSVVYWRCDGTCTQKLCFPDTGLRGPALAKKGSNDERCGCRERGADADWPF
jgi:hypothetical protein